MHQPTPVVTACALLLLGVSTLSGCEDPTAKQRRQVAARIDDIASRLSGIGAGPVAPGGESFDERRTQLQGLAGELRGVSDLPGAPSTAKSLLTSTVHRELATLSLTEAEQIEAALTRERQILNRMTALGMPGGTRVG